MYMYKLTHTFCINCFREETWNKSWSEFQFSPPRYMCCSHSRRALMSGPFLDDGFFSKPYIFISALELEKEKKKRWIKNTEINRHMKSVIMEDLMDMGFIESSYGDWLWDLNIESRWFDRTVVINYPI